jgi:hypothetical protein
MSNDENTPFAGSSPAMRTTFSRKNDDSCVPDILDRAFKGEL